jgi:uncharacterized protein YoxC
MATQQDAATLLAGVTAELAAVKDEQVALKATVEKVGTETDGLLDKIQLLEDAAANAGALDPALAQAIADVSTAADSVKSASADSMAAAGIVDSKVPDAAP